MIYQLDYNLKPSPILPWCNIFWCLSLKQFREVYDLLDFPFSPPDDLRQVAHDFSLAYMTLLRGLEYASALETLLDNGETVSTDLLEGTASNDPYAKKLDFLFTNTFAYLERFGYAEAVYQWGKQTESYVQHADRQKYEYMMALRNWCHLLRIWAVLEWIQQPHVPERGSYPNEWDDVFAYFVPIYQKVQQTIAFLPLSQTSRALFQRIILNGEARKMHLRMATDKIMASPKSVWEEIALRNHVAVHIISLEGGMRIDLNTWNKIANALSVDEMHTLEQWALQYENIPGRKLKIPLPDFRS